jgi:hypothetical protein
MTIHSMPDIPQWTRNSWHSRAQLYIDCNDTHFFLWGETKSLGTVATSGLLYKPQMIDEGDCGAIGGMKIGRGNRSTRRKPAPVPLCPPQIPHDQTWAAVVGSQ